MGRKLQPSEESLMQGTRGVELQLLCLVSSSPLGHSYPSTLHPLLTALKLLGTSTLLTSF